MPRADQRGVILLEVIVAMSLLAFAGVGLCALVTQSIEAVGRAGQTDEQTSKASAYLEVVSVWTRADLDRHLGSRRAGPWWLEIQRPEPSLYTVSLADSSSTSVLFRTVLYRPADDVAQAF